MAGLGIRLYTDEMIPSRIAAALRQRGYDAVSCHDVGRANRAIPDADQLSYAAQDGRAILSFNMVDYVPLDSRWKAMGHQHSGIIVSPAIDDFRSLLRCVQRHLDTYSPEVQADILLWLDTTPAP
jgi:hypothetical protein